MNEFTDVITDSESPVSVFMPQQGRKLVGILSFSTADGVNLDLLDVGGLNSMLIASEKEYPLIHGELLGGKPITLINGVMRSTNIGMGAVGKIRIRFTQLLVGMHLEAQDSSVFLGASVTMTMLNEWHAESPFTENWDLVQMPRQKGSIAVEMRYTQRIGFTPLCNSISLMSDQTLRPEGDRLNSVALNSTQVMRLIPKSATTIDRVSEEVFKLQAFISILCKRQSYITSVRLLIQKDSKKVPVHFLAHYAKTNSDRKISISEIAFPLPMVRDELPLLWQNWNERYLMYKSAVELYVSTEMFTGQLLNFQYLAILQAIETFHRNRFEGRYLTEPDYDIVKGALIGSIPAKVDPDLKAALKSRVKYGNEYSLRKRLKELCKLLSDEERELLHPNLTKFMDRVVDTRNYLTHYTADLEKSAFSDEEQFWAIVILRWLFVAVLLRDMGIQKSHLVDAMSSAAELDYAMKRASGQKIKSGIIIKNVNQAAATAEEGGGEKGK